jgi:succinate dehydrogenase hydrophobic anchor subunit
VKVHLTKARIALVIVEVTSIPLLLLSAIYVITGYQLVYPDKIWLFPSPRAIHADKVLRVATIALGALHGVAGVVLLCERKIRNKFTRSAVELVVLIIIAVLFIMLLIADIIY